MAHKKLRATLVNITDPKGPYAKKDSTALTAKGFLADVIIFHRKPRSRDMEDYASFLQSITHSQIGKVINGL